MSRLSKTIVVLVISVFALATASVALAGFTKGVYRTNPPANRTKFLDFSFTATKSQAKQVRYTYRATSACSNGGAAVGDEGVYLIPAAAIKKQSGKFSINVTNSGGGHLVITGKVSGRKASGTLRDRFTSGSVTCDTRTLHWTAKHLG